MALTNSDIIDFVVWVTGRSRDNVEILLEEWLSDRDSVYISPENRKVISKIQPTDELILSGLESRYSSIVKYMSDNYDEITSEQYNNFIEELNNLEHKIEAYESKIK